MCSYELGSVPQATMRSEALADTSNEGSLGKPREASGNPTKAARSLRKLQETPGGLKKLQGTPRKPQETFRNPQESKTYTPTIYRG